jgi:hypothetical protein
VQIHDEGDFARTYGPFVPRPTSGVVADAARKFYSPGGATWAGHPKRIGYVEMEPVTPSRTAKAVEREYSASVHARARVCILSFISAMLIAALGLITNSSVIDTISITLMSISIIAFMSWMEKARHEQKSAS